MAAASFTARSWRQHTVLHARRRLERAEEREVASASEEQRAPGARFTCTEVGRGGKRGGTQEPRGGKPLYMSATFKNSRLAQKCLNTRLNLHFLASLSPKPFSFGTRGSNKCCRSIGKLQHCQYQHRLKLHGFQTMRHQSTLHEN